MTMQTMQMVFVDLRRVNRLSGCLINLKMIKMRQRTDVELFVYRWEIKRAQQNILNRMPIAANRITLQK